MKLGIYSRGIWKIPNLSSFLPEYQLTGSRNAQVLGGWGYKKSSAKPRKIANRKRKKYVALEDGFIRSYGLGVSGAPPLSIVVDDVGIYYDAFQPSRLEEIIKSGMAAGDIERAKKLIAEIKLKKISKYNCYKENWEKPTNKNCVLVIDQCEGDASINYGMASAKSFEVMLKKAREENPQHHILIKVHPDVVVGKRKGYINLKGFDASNLITENINPHTLFEQVDKVYTVTSLAGFEALMHGRYVRCFGMPFYAGWGLTNDAISLERRNVNKSFEEVFAAIYFHYSRYVNPFSGQASAMEEIINIIDDAKKYYAAHNENYHCVGFTRWKRYFVVDYLKSPFNRVKFYNSEKKAVAAAFKNNEPVVVWAARETPELAKSTAKIYRMEDGFIRSIGLGSDFIAANSLVLDKTGIHFDHSRPSDIENILNEGKFPAVELTRAHALQKAIIEKAITKYNTENNNINFELPNGKTIILAAGQVESDASIRLGAVDIRSNQQLVSSIRQSNKDAFIIYKPHPDVVSGNRKEDFSVEGADLTVTDVGIHSLIKLADEVHVITSLVGFEALLHGKKVVIYGLPFYAGWGLTHDRHEHPRRKRAATLDEMIAATLIKYPSYFDFEAQLPCRAEDIVEKFSRSTPAKSKRRLIRRVVNGVSGIIKS